MTRMSAPVPHPSNHQQAVDKFLWVAVRLSRLRKPLNNRLNLIMVSSEFGTGKSIVVLAIVVGCFAILWPKIFYPMMQAAFAITSPGTERSERSFRPRDRPPHLQPGILNTNGREGAPDGAFIKEGRPFPHPSSRQPVKPQSKSGGAMSIIMPIYTIGIVVFFLYTVLKLVFKKPPEAEKKPLIKDFHMDPEYHKFVCQQPAGSDKTSKKEATSTTKSKEQPKATVFDEKNGNFDEKDYEIYKLRKKLEETESAMERIMKHMGAVSDCLSNACLLKDNTVASKDLNSTVSTPKSSTKSKPSLKIKKEKKKISQTTAGVDKSLLEVNEKNNEEETKELFSDCPNEQDTELDLQLKKDPSINSEASSFELLSQCLSNGSVAVDSSEAEDGEEEEKDNNDNEFSDCEKFVGDIEDDAKDSDKDEDDNSAKSEEESSENEVNSDHEISRENKIGMITAQASG